MIELIEEQNKIYQVYFSEEFIKNIHEDIMGKDLSWKNSSFSSREFKEFLLLKEKEGAKRLLLRKLARKALLTIEAKNLLLERFIDEETASEVISSLLTYFDDASIMESKIRHKMRKSHAKDKIQRDLWKYKIPEEIFDETYMKVEEEENLDPISQICAFIKKKDQGDKQRLISQLYRRGYDLDDIHKSLSLLNNLEDR